MIFNKHRTTKVQYFINTEIYSMDFGKSFFPNIEKYSSNLGTKCPSVQSIKNRIYKVLSPLTIDVELVNNDDKLTYNYNFDDKTFLANENNHLLLDRLLMTEKTINDFRHFQFFTPYTFITDDKDLEIMTMPYSNNSNNVEFIAGSFKPYSWLRNINGSWKLIDNKKNGKIQFNLRDPIFLITFNKPVELEYVIPNKKVIDFYNESKNIVNVRNNLKDIYKTVESRREKRLIDKSYRKFFR